MPCAADFGRWIPSSCGRPLSSARCRLLCFPYAGAGASMFRYWAEKLPPWIEMVPVQLPGRESRWAEKPFLDLPMLAAALRVALHPLLCEPYALFGHSMGGLVAFEFARELRRRKLPLPYHLFVSGTRAPHLPDRELLLHPLSDALLWKTVMRDYGSGQDEAMLNAELAPVLLPILRADFQLCESYEPLCEEPFSFPVTVYGGREDRRVTYSDLLSWSTYTHRAFRLELLPGGHFFLVKNHGLFLETLARDLAALDGQKQNTPCAAD
jgi:medium-chain acyl-[acyl-carrier-protein] hydrolase